jgi:hypothetical protein
MFGSSNRLLAGAVVALSALGPLGAAMSASSSSAHTPDDRLACEIRTVERFGSVAVEPVVTADRRISGEYRLRLESSGGGGRSDVTQGGPFTALAGEETVLGSVTLNRGATLDVRLEVTADGERLVCEDRIRR